MATIVYIAIATFLASIIATTTGFGTSTILIPIILFFLPLPQTLLFVGIIHWVGDIWKLLLFKKGLNRKLIFSFGIPGIIATTIGANIIFFAVNEKFLHQALGAFLISYAIVLIIKPTFEIKKDTKTAVIGGTLYGFTAGIFGVGGAIRSVFLSAFNLPKATYLATTGAIAFVIDSTRLSTYLVHGVRNEGIFGWGLFLFIPVSFAGAIFAKKIVGNIPQSKFRIIILSALFLVGIKFLFFPG